MGKRNVLIRDLVLLLLLLLLCPSHQIEASRILFIPMQQRSHVIGHLSASAELVSRGHEVYIALGSTYPDPDEIEASTGVRVLQYRVPDDNGIEIFGDGYNRFIADSVFVTHDKINELEMTVALLNRDCTYMMEDAEFVSRVKSLNLDLVVADGFPFHPCPTILPHSLGIPYATITAVYTPWRIRSPAMLAPIPSLFKISYPMNFLDRIKCLFAYVMDSNINILWGNYTLLKKYANDGITDWTELSRKSLIFFWERDYHFDFHVPVFPNVILVPGLTASPAKPIDGELGHIMNTSGGRDGIVLVSFGSTSHYMPHDITVKFLKAFEDVPLTFIVKLSIPKGVRLPENVVVKSWIPQNDILGHRNTKLFITHCGSNGQYEALYHGVPMIGMPFFAEQDHNCFRLEVKRLGIRMNVHHFTSDELHRNIIEVLSNSTYRDAVQGASERWHAEPMTSREKVAFWVEHVIKYGGDHLRSNALDMSLVEFLLLDVLGFITVTVVIGFVASLYALNCLARRFR